MFSNLCSLFLLSLSFQTVYPSSPCPVFREKITLIGAGRGGVVAILIIIIMFIKKLQKSFGVLTLSLVNFCLVYFVAPVLDQIDVLFSLKTSSYNVG
jgi:hypothetical protein